LDEEPSASTAPVPRLKIRSDANERLVSRRRTAEANRRIAF
jgi:hypothetical protein